MTEGVSNRVKDLKIIGAKPGIIEGICYDSRRVTPNCAFVAIKGETVDGHDFIFDAIRHGATTIIAERKPASKIPSRVTFVLTNDSRAALAKMADYFYNSPSEKLNVIGITGTNGKTTTSYIIQSIMKQAEKPCGRIGTTGYDLLETSLDAVTTTPESLDLQKMMSKLVKAGASHLALEVSSHALIQRRVNNVKFKTAVFTNLTQDHLDYHENMEDYFSAKAGLFTRFAPKIAVINIDDEYGRRIAETTKSEKITYGISTPADFMAEDIRVETNSVSMTIKTPEGNMEITSSLGGRYNVYNILAASAVALSEGVPLDLIKEGVENLKNVPGRMERVDEGQPFIAIVDFAHTSDALKNVINSARELTKGKVITVFGCGGDRDKGKRPLMGESAWKLSDKIVVTSDNPRTEKPREIIEDILKGIKEKDNPQGEMKIEPDRREAIRMAVMLAEHGDLVLVAGKGHENYQIIGTKKTHFDDKEELREAIGKRYG